MPYDQHYILRGYLTSGRGLSLYLVLCFFFFAIINIFLCTSTWLPSIPVEFCGKSDCFIHKVRFYEINIIDLSLLNRCSFFYQVLEAL